MGTRHTRRRGIDGEKLRRELVWVLLVALVIVIIVALFAWGETSTIHDGGVGGSFSTRG